MGKLPLIPQQGEQSFACAFILDGGVCARESHMIVDGEGCRGVNFCQIRLWPPRSPVNLEMLIFASL